MRIAVIGAGRIGGTIGEKWEAAGHEVVYGLRDPAKKTPAKSMGEALKGAEVVLLAIPGNAVKQLAHDHAEDLNGKIVIDATNNMGGAGGKFHEWDLLSQASPKAQLYRAFNSYGFEIFQNAKVGGHDVDLFYAGPEGASKDKVERLIKDIGLNPVWVGDAETVDTVDGVLKLWFTLSRRRGRRIAFKLVSE